MTNTKCIALDDIITDAGTQVRVNLCESTVDRYAEEMRDGCKFPPVVVFHDGSRFILADGFHRVLAAKRAEFLDILADVRLGGKPEALRHALGANVTHGLPRTNADKRRSVELALAQWPDISSVMIAKTCAVSHTFVDSFRAQLATVASSVNQAATVAPCEAPKRKGADGKEYKQPAKRNKVSDTAGEKSGTSGLGEVGTSSGAGKANAGTPPPGPSADAQLVAALGITPDEVLGEMLRAVAIETEEALAISNPEWLSMLADAHQRAADTLREKAASM